MRKVTLYDIVTKELMVEDFNAYVRHINIPLERNQIIEPHDGPISEISMDVHDIPIRQFVTATKRNNNEPEYKNIYVASTENMNSLVHKITGETWESIDKIKNSNETMKQTIKDLRAYKNRVNNLNFMDRLKYLFTTNIK